MAKLYFKYGAMGSSKTAQALITKYNYEENDLKVWLLKPSADCRDGIATLRSRIGLEAEVEVVSPEEDLYRRFQEHAFTGSLVAERIFGERPEVCSAIRYHTTGRAGMTRLEEILYIADFIEPNRDFPGVEELRQATDESLDRGVLLGLERTYARLQAKGLPIAGATIEAILDRKDRRA